MVVVGSGVINCHRLNLNGEISWADLEPALSRQEGIPFLPVPVDQEAQEVQKVTSFQSGIVKTGWLEDSFCVYATLADQDIFNPVTADHLPAYSQGDVFEIFLRPEGQESYREFHITPDNFRLQLSIPSVAAFQSAKQAGQGIPSEWFVRDEIVHSEVRCSQEKSEWSVWVRIPFEMILEQGKPRPAAGSQWHFSFSRYDYTRGEDQPVLSSTSRHAEINFHQQQDWKTLMFCE